MFEVNANLVSAANLSLRLPISEKELVIMCDAGEHAANYDLVTEYYTETADFCTTNIRPLNCPTDIMETYLVGELPNSNGFRHILTETDVFLPCVFAVPLKEED